MMFCTIIYHPSERQFQQCLSICEGDCSHTSCYPTLHTQLECHKHSSVSDGYLFHFLFFLLLKIVARATIQAARKQVPLHSCFHSRYVDKLNHKPCHKRFKENCIKVIGKLSANRHRTEKVITRPLQCLFLCKFSFCAVQHSFGSSLPSLSALWDGNIVLYRPGALQDHP